MRSIWKGHIRFLFVAIPVRIYNAVEASEKIQFNQLHREDFGPIGYDKRCKKCGQVVTNEEITKGYQYEADRYAIVEPEEIAKVKIKTNKAVDIMGFVDASEIPTTFFDAPYYAGPDERDVRYRLVKYECQYRRISPVSTGDNVPGRRRDVA